MRWIDVRCAMFPCLVLAMILAACGGGSTTSPSPTPTPVQPVQPPALTGTPDQNADALIAVMTTRRENSARPRHWIYRRTPTTRRGWLCSRHYAHLNIPDLYLADGSVGVGNSVGQATALPSSIASAASWDLSEAYKYGQVIGAESKALGMNVNLGGNVN